MKNKHTAPPQIEMLKPSELTVEKDFNPRQNFKENVKELRAHVEARGFIDPSTHVVQYVERDGKKIVRGGHTLLQAAKELQIKEVPACKADLDPISEQVNLIISNTGKPLSAYEQGTVFVRLRDGQLREGLDYDEAGKVKDGKKVRPLDKEKDFYRKPITGKEIAELVGVSQQHVSQCMIVREADPAISEKMMEGKISAYGVMQALMGVKSTEKQLRIINAAIAHAKENGKETAAKADVDAVKDQFMEKKQVAAPLPGAPTTTTTETTSTNKDSVKETKTSKEPKAPEPPAPDLFKEGGEDQPPTADAHPVDHTGKELTPEMRALYDGKVPEGKADLVKRVISVIDFWSVDLPNVDCGALTGEEIEILAVAIVKTLETPI